MKKTIKNETILIDGGGSNTGSFDVGENTLLPYIIVKEKNIPVIVGKRGDKINIEKDLYLDILFPESEQI